MMTHSECVALCAVLDTTEPEPQGPKYYANVDDAVCSVVSYYSITGLTYNIAVEFKPVGNARYKLIMYERYRHTVYDRN